MLNLPWPQATNGCKGQQGAYRHASYHRGRRPSLQRHTTDTKLVAYSYRRWSTPAQNDGHSLTRQTEAAARWCADTGYQLDLSTINIDAGVSALSLT